MIRDKRAEELCMEMARTMARGGMGCMASFAYAIHGTHQNSKMLKEGCARISSMREKKCGSVQRQVESFLWLNAYIAGTAIK